jgi:hypothetical protein
MDDAQREWQERYDRSFGPREFLRSLGAMFFLQLIAGALATLLHSNIPIAVATFSPLAFAFVATSWKPAYWILRTVWGNANMPMQPRPRTKTWLAAERLPWWGFLPAIWFLVISVIVYYLAFKYFAR